MTAQAMVCSYYFPADQCEQIAMYSWYCGPEHDISHRQYFGYCEMEANGGWGCECADSITTITPTV
ncbi:MAG: hypothetical protein M1837_006380 [Sclerophora amabilis]|nr:MAG: hypothetical protein M1837_006380 [Sclerophora amabilis]